MYAPTESDAEEVRFLSLLTAKDNPNTPIEGREEHSGRQYDLAS